MTLRQWNSTLPAPAKPMNRGKGIRRKRKEPIGGAFASAEKARKPLNKRSRKRAASTEVMRATRAEVWAKTGGRCACCGAPATEDHHVLPRSQGGTDDVNNRIPLCGRCHRHVHEHPAESYAKGYLVRADKRFSFAPSEPESVGAGAGRAEVEHSREGDAATKPTVATPVLNGAVGALKETA